MEQIMKQLDDGKSIEETDLKIQLTTLKQLHADWLVELHIEMTKSEGKEVIMCGRKAIWIIEVIEKGSTQLESLDPFSDLDPLLTQTTNEEISLTNLGGNEREAFNNLYAKDEEGSDGNDTYLPKDGN